MNAKRFDRLTTALATVGTRRGLLQLLPLAGGLCALNLTDAAAKKRNPKKNKKKKNCAKAGQATSKKRKKCCPGLAKDASGRCAQPAGSCTPATCPPTACGSVPDGCGGTLRCGCPANQICLRSGVCQPCTVTCTGTLAQCGAALQTAMNGGGTVYVCPGRYQGGFTLSPPLATLTLIGAGEGADPTSNTILDAHDLGRVLSINAGVGTVELERLRLTDGNTASGAGILHLGPTLRLTECTVSGNIANGSGGGIVAGGHLELTRCTVRDNHAGTSGQGGGILTSGTATLTDCLVADNRARFGGGLSAEDATITLAGSTQVRDNAADFGGGIFILASTLLIAETCRVTENTAPPDQGGGIRNNSGTVTLAGADPSPIVVNNCRENCVGTVPTCALTPVSCPP
jgi:hypothetical protein